MKREILHTTKEEALEAIKNLTQFCTRIKS